MSSEAASVSTLSHLPPSQMHRALSAPRCPDGTKGQRAGPFAAALAAVSVPLPWPLSLTMHLNCWGLKLPLESQMAEISPTKMCNPQLQPRCFGLCCAFLEVLYSIFL